MAAALLLAVGAAPYAPAQSGPAVPPPPAAKPPAPAPLPSFRLPTTTTEAVPSGVDARACQGRFVEHLLEHTTAAGDERIGLYAGNGAGVGVGDLDGDGDLEVVLANLDGPNSVHWNEGGLRFRVQSLPVEASPAVHLIDADGDGRLDLFFTHTALAPTLWLNVGTSGGAEFVRADAGVRELLYTADWADFDADGDLDLLGATYDAELHSTAPGATGGVFVYRNGGDPGAAGGLLRLDARLATHSQALAVLAGDLDGDGDLDIVVNNLAAPARLFENRLCVGDHLQIDLRWPAAANRYAVGARVHLDTSTGSYTRTVRAASGYLSGDAPRLHFGVPPGSRLLAARIVWPDGEPSALRDPPVNHLITVTRYTGPGGG